MGVTTYTCPDCDRKKTVEEQGSYPTLTCDSDRCGGAERVFVHPTDMHKHQFD